MKKLIIIISDLRLRFHWYYIGKLRREAKSLIDKGTGCFHPDLVTLSNKILVHGMIVSEIWNQQKQYAACHIDTEEPEQEDRQAFTA